MRLCRYDWVTVYVHGACNGNIRVSVNHSIAKVEYLYICKKKNKKTETPVVQERRKGILNPNPGERSPKVGFLQNILNVLSVK